MHGYLGLILEGVLKNKCSKTAYNFTYSQEYKMISASLLFLQTQKLRSQTNFEKINANIIVARDI
jgi:hypothetical protein